MANSLLTIDEITAESLRVLHNSLPFIKNIDKQHDKDTTIAGRPRGASLRIKQPNQYTVRSDWTLNAQDQSEQSDTLTIGSVRGVDMNFTDADLATDITEFSNRFITPAVKRLASEVDSVTFTKMVKATYNQVGTPATTPASAQVYLDAMAKMSNFAAPLDGRCTVINPVAQARTVDGLKSLFNNASEISKQYTTGQMGMALGSEFFMSQNVPVLTTGSRVGTIVVDGTVATAGSTVIHLDGFTNATDTIKQGETFTVAGVYSVNPETKQSTGQLQDFVVTADFTAVSNEGDVSVSPAMYTSGALQTIDAFPQDGAAIVFSNVASAATTDATDYPINLSFCKDAYTFATAKLEMPSDVSFKGQMEQDGLNIRLLRQYDINNAQHPMRLDIFFGSLAQRPSQACRIIG